MERLSVKLEKFQGPKTGGIIVTKMLDERVKSGKPILKINTKNPGVESTPPFPSPTMSDSSSPVPPPDFSAGGFDFPDTANDSVNHGRSLVVPTKIKESGSQNTLFSLLSSSSQEGKQTAKSSISKNATNKQTTAVPNGDNGVTHDLSESKTAEMVAKSTMPEEEEAVMDDGDTWELTEHSSERRRSTRARRSRAQTEYYASSLRKPKPRAKKYAHEDGHASDKQKSELTKKKQRAKQLIGMYVFVRSGRMCGHVGYVRRGGNGYFNVDIVDSSRRDTTLMKRSSDLHGLDLSRSEIEELRANGPDNVLKNHCQGLLEEGNVPDKWTESSPSKSKKAKKRRALHDVSDPPNTRNHARQDDVAIHKKRKYHRNEGKSGGEHVDIHDAAGILLGILYQEPDELRHQPRRHPSQQAHLRKYRRATQDESAMYTTPPQRAPETRATPTSHQIALNTTIRNTSRASSRQVSPSLTGFANMGVDMQALVV